jgi:hypothetical protein
MNESILSTRPRERGKEGERCQDRGRLKKANHSLSTQVGSGTGNGSGSSGQWEEELEAGRGVDDAMMMIPPFRWGRPLRRPSVVGLGPVLCSVLRDLISPAVGL